MAKRRRRIFQILISLAGVLAIFSANAGEYHTGQLSTCSDCHVEHASLNGVPVASSPKLLKSATGEVGLCMSCHDGTNGQAPAIVADGTFDTPTNHVGTPYTSKYGSSAGFFQKDYLTKDPDPQYYRAHSLYAQSTATVPLSNTYTKAGLVCSDCHDPHGSPNYRNLLTNPNPNITGSFPILVGTQVKETTPVNAQNPNPAVAYDTGNMAFAVQNNISAWCTSCHDQLAPGYNLNHFGGHPSDQVIGAAWTAPWQTYPADAGAAANWQNTGTGLGFGSAVGDDIAGIPRLRFGSPTTSNQTASSGDTVFCLSCHKAHGSQYTAGLVWPYFEGGADMNSGCQQCHFQ